ncbi:hypothetical protein EJD97_022285 [Solanum chilense]|uniref:Uncharacterized protein n=1 Tax=Solanum chilense TaxID=4083 RepID=A0A6N2AD73_SOLCI|nr:hypothetical protein EJD97_022285 [Solanum chilense]
MECSSNANEKHSTNKKHKYKQNIEAEGSPKEAFSAGSCWKQSLELARLLFGVLFTGVEAHWWWGFVVVGRSC